MKARCYDLIRLGPWKRPICGNYSPLGSWFRLHLVRVHSMSEYRASRYMVRMTQDLPVYQNVPFLMERRRLVQSDLFDKRAALV